MMLSKCSCTNGIQPCSTIKHYCICQRIFETPHKPLLCMTKHHDCICILSSITLDYSYQQTKRCRECKSTRHNCICHFDFNKCQSSEHYCICVHNDTDECRFPHKTKCFKCFRFR